MGGAAIRSIQPSIAKFGGDGNPYTLQVLPSAKLYAISTQAKQPSLEQHKVCRRAMQGGQVTPAQKPPNSSKGFNKVFCFVFVFVFVFVLVFCLFRAALVAYGDSQARGPIRATATSHSNARSELRLRPTPQLAATSDP